MLPGDRDRLHQAISVPITSTVFPAQQTNPNKTGNPSTTLLQTLVPPLNASSSKPPLGVYPMFTTHLNAIIPQSFPVGPITSSNQHVLPPQNPLNHPLPSALTICSNNIHATSLSTLHQPPPPILGSSNLMGISKLNKLPTTPMVDRLIDPAKRYSGYTSLSQSVLSTAGNQYVKLGPPSSTLISPRDPLSQRISTSSSGSSYVSPTYHQSTTQPLDSLQVQSSQSGLTPQMVLSGPNQLNVTNVQPSQLQQSNPLMIPLYVNLHHQHTQQFQTQQQQQLYSGVTQFSQTPYQASSAQFNISHSHNQTPTQSLQSYQQQQLPQAPLPPQTVEPNIHVAPIQSSQQRSVQKQARVVEKPQTEKVQSRPRQPTKRNNPVTRELTEYMQQRPRRDAKVADQGIQQFSGKVEPTDPRTNAPLSTACFYTPDPIREKYVTCSRCDYSSIPATFPSISRHDQLHEYFLDPTCQLKCDICEIGLEQKKGFNTHLKVYPRHAGEDIDQIHDYSKYSSSNAKYRPISQFSTRDDNLVDIDDDVYSDDVADNTQKSLATPKIIKPIKTKKVTPTNESLFTEDYNMINTASFDLTDSLTLQNPQVLTAASQETPILHGNSSNDDDDEDDDDDDDVDNTEQPLSFTRINSSRYVTCHRCNRSIDSSAIKKHEKQHALFDAIDTEARCNICETGYSNQRSLTRHTRNQHPEKAAATPRFWCDSCDVDVPQVSVERHAQMHALYIDPTTPEAQKCHRCKLGFDGTFACERHMHKHNPSADSDWGKKQSRPGCDRCGLHFVGSSFEIHAIAHQNYDSDPTLISRCDICEVAYTNVPALKSHLSSKNHVRRAQKIKSKAVQSKNVIAIGTVDLSAAGIKFSSTASSPALGMMSPSPATTYQHNHQLVRPQQNHSNSLLDDQQTTTTSNTPTITAPATSISAPSLPPNQPLHPQL